MRNLRFSLFAGLLGLAGALPATAQHYRPFGPARTYHYREAAATAGAADSLFTFRVDSVSVSGTDSIFYFNRTFRPFPATHGRRANVFGGWQRWNPATGVAIFGAEGTATTVALRTRAALGTSWPFSGALTAAVTARFFGTVLGQPDSLLTITVSDGQTLTVARRFGVVAAPGFDQYLGVAYALGPRARALTLAGVPEAGLGTLDLRPASIWSWQPGDHLYYYTQFSWDDSFPPHTGSSSYAFTEDRLVQQLRQSANGDTLILIYLATRYGTHYLTPNYTGPNSPFTVVDTGEVVVILPQENYLTGTAHYFGFDATMRCAIASQHPDSVGNRPRLHYSWGFDGQFGAQRGAWTWAVGPGEIRSDLYIEQALGNTVSHTRHSHLIGLEQQNGSFRWGVTALGQPLGSKINDQAAALLATLAPNPTNGRSTLAFSVEAPQSASLVLYDALGRAVWQQAAALSAGPQRLPIAPNVALAPGLYRLRLTLADGRQRLLPLVRE